VLCIQQKFLQSIYIWLSLINYHFIWVIYTTWKINQAPPTLQYWRIQQKKKTTSLYSESVSSHNYNQQAPIQTHHALHQKHAHWSHKQHDKWKNCYENKTTWIIAHILQNSELNNRSRTHYIIISHTLYTTFTNGRMALWVFPAQSAWNCKTLSVCPLTTSLKIPYKFHTILVRGPIILQAPGKLLLVHAGPM
jgi:hypothetical protein